MQSISEQLTDGVNITVTDWEGHRSALLSDVVRDTTVGEILEEARRAMDLPIETAYQALFDGRELNHMETLKEAGIDADAELEILPDVQAG